MRVNDEAELTEVSRLFKLLGHPKRLALLTLLVRQPMTVSEISTVLKWEQSAVSHQLQVLRHCQVVERTRDDSQVVYRLTDPRIPSLLAEAINNKRP